MPALSPQDGARGGGAVRERSIRWLDQTIFHTETTHGNCMQAAVASLFGLPLAAVPKFAEEGERCHLALLNFAESFGFNLTAERVCKYREGLYLACGQTARGTHHMVVYRDGKLWHDPHPSRAGLTAVEFSYIIEPLDPALHVAAFRLRERLAPLLAKASPGPWEADSLDSEDGWGAIKSRHLMDATGKTVLDALNSEVATSVTEDDEDGSYTFDAQGLADCAYVEALDEFARALNAACPDPAPAPAADPRGRADG